MLPGLLAVGSKNVRLKADSDVMILGVGAAISTTLTETIVSKKPEISLPSLHPKSSAYRSHQRIIRRCSRVSESDSKTLISDRKSQEILRISGNRFGV